MRAQSPNLLLVAVLVALLSTIENWCFGPLSWIYAYGSGLETIPTLLALSFDHRNFAGWAPFATGGVDRLAFWGNATPISLEVLLFSFLPTWVANASHRFLQYFIGVYFTSRVLRDHLDQPAGWAAFGGVLFACFAYLTVGQLLTLSSVPLMIWMLERAMRGHASWLVCLAVGVGLSFLTTFSFGVPYLIAFAVAWLVARGLLYDRKQIAGMLAFALGLTVPNLPQAFAAVLNAPASHRAGWLPEPLTVSLGSLFHTQLQYDLFNQDKTLSAITQVLPVALFVPGIGHAVLLLRRKPERRPLALAFITAAGLYLLFAQKWLLLLIQSAVATVIPWVNGIYMGRFFEIPASFLIAVGLTLLARLALCELPWAWARRAAAAAGIAFAVFMIVQPKIFLFEPLGLGDWGQANYRVPVLDGLRMEAAAREPFRVASVLPLQPAYAYAQGLEAADGWANIYPLRYRELWLEVLRPLVGEIPATRQIFGFDSGRSEDNFVFLGAGLMMPGIGRLPGEDTDVALRHGFDLDRRFRLDILRLLNVRYLLSEYPLKGNSVRLVHAPAQWPTWPLARDRNTGLVTGAYPPLPPEVATGSAWARAWHRFDAALKRKAAGKDVFVYELEGAVPRVRLVSELTIVPDGRRALDALAALRGDEIATRAVVEASEAAGVVDSTTFAPGGAELTSYTPDRRVIRTSAPGRGFLVLAENWSPYWRAWVDGAAAPIVRVNHTQMGLVLEPGTHEIVFAYPTIWQSLLRRFTRDTRALD